MGTRLELRDRLWRDRLVTALRLHLGVELDEAETLAGLILIHGIPPGQDEAQVHAALWRSPGATTEWVAQVMRIVQSVRDGIRLPNGEADQPAEAGLPEPEQRPPVPLQPVTMPAPKGTPSGSGGDQELLLALVIERLRAVDQFKQLAPKVVGAQKNLRTLRIAVSGESDDSVRLPHLLAEWLEARREWEVQNQVLQSAQATLRATEWLIPYLQGGTPKAQ